MKDSKNQINRGLYVVDEQPITQRHCLYRNSVEIGYCQYLILPWEDYCEKQYRRELEESTGIIPSFMVSDVIGFILDFGLPRPDKIIVIQNVRIINPDDRRKGYGTQLISDIIETYTTNSTIVLLQSSVNKDEYPEEPTNVEMKEILIRNAVFFEACGFCNINEFVDYETQEAFIYVKNEIGYYTALKILDQCVKDIQKQKARLIKHYKDSKSKTLCDGARQVIKESRIDISEAELLQKAKLYMMYDPDSYASGPSFTMFFRLMVFNPKNCKYTPYEVEFNTEVGLVEVRSSKFVINNLKDSDPVYGNAIRCSTLSVIETEPLPGREKQPRFDNALKD